MQRSFYCNLVLTIGILAAIEIILKFGIIKAIIPMIADIFIVLILVVLIYHLESAPPSLPKKFQKPLNERQNLQLRKWKKQHDRWWAKYKNN